MSAYKEPEWHEWFISYASGGEPYLARKTFETVNARDLQRGDRDSYDDCVVVAMQCEVPIEMVEKLKAAIEEWKKNPNEKKDEVPF